MNKNIARCAAVFAFIAALTIMPAAGGVDPILGKWIGKADTPNGLMDLELVFTQAGDQLQGSVLLMQSQVPLRAIKFEDPQVSLEISFGGADYKLMATAKDGKLKGTWEQIGGDLKGTFAAERQSTAPSQVVGISGDWNLVAQTPNGEMPATLTLKQENGQLIGLIASERGSLPLLNTSFKESKLQFDVEMGGATYRLEGLFDENRLSGKWTPVGGGEGGTWNAKRKLPAPPASAGATPLSLDGDWNSVAVTPNGELPMKLSLKQDGGNITGNLSTPDGSVPIQKASYSQNKLSFEVTHESNIYIVEATLVEGKFQGQWKVSDGSESGAWKAERIKP